MRAKRCDPLSEMVSKARRGVLDDSSLTPALLHASDEEVYRLLGVEPPDTRGAAAPDGHVASVDEQTRESRQPKRRQRPRKA
jgi:hypothetical protein